MFRLSPLVLWKSVLLTALCAWGVFGLWWFGFVHAIQAQGQRRAEEALVQVERGLAREFHRAEETGRAFGIWWTRQGGRLDDPAQLQQVIPFLERGAIVTNLILSREDGDSANVLRIGDAWNLFLFAEGKPTRRFLLQDGSWVPGPANNRETYDPRRREWYRFGRTQPGPAWTPHAYRYFGSSAAGFTFAVPVRSSRGSLEGVVGVDVSLEEVTQLVWKHHPTQRSRLLAVDADERLLVPVRRPGLDDFSERLAQHLLPVSEAMQLEQLHRGTTPGGQDLQESSFDAQSAYAVPGHPRLLLRVAIPKGELFPGHRLQARLGLLLAAGSVLGIAWILLDLNQRIVRPMRRLAAGAGQGGDGAVASEGVDSDIWEFRQVGERLRLAGRAEREREGLMRQVEHSQRVDSVGVLAPGLVHDLNNQLSMAMGQISICHTLLEGQPELQTRLQEAERVTLQGAQMMRSLLEFSRPIDPGQRERLSLNGVVEGAAELLRRVLGDSYRVEAHLAIDLPVLFGEPMKLQQVLVNLGLNARDAMPEGGLLEFRTYRLDNQICLEVRDTGCGMDAEVKRRLFEPFFTTKPPGKGTGLGLAMVARIVAAHGGSINVDSEPGQGTRFQIRFPPSLRRRVGDGAEQAAAVGSG